MVLNVLINIEQQRLLDYHNLVSLGSHASSGQQMGSRESIKMAIVVLGITRIIYIPGRLHF